MAADQAIPVWLEDQCSRLLSNDDKVQNLNLNLRKIDDEALMQILVGALQENSDILVINLVTSMQQNNDVLNIFVEGVLCDHSSLQTLLLSYNGLRRDHGIGAALAANSVLSTLDLDYNSIGSVGIDALSAGLKVNKTLKELRLNYNRVGDDGAISLANALVDNTSLEHLGLRRNGIADRGIAALLALLRKNATLNNVDVQHNVGGCRITVDKIYILCQANKHGRRYIQDPTFSISLWPHVLQRAQRDPDLLYWWTSEKYDSLKDWN